jgi:hypothetical protein
MEEREKLLEVEKRGIYQWKQYSFMICMYAMVFLVGLVLVCATVMVFEMFNLVNFVVSTPDYVRASPSTRLRLDRDHSMALQ